MRELTIKRTKCFVGCFAKMKVYIEDPTSNELMIHQVPCRKIGDLKNGEEKTFQIEEQALKVFVIGDKMTKEICCDCYQLPEGEEPVTLSGKNYFNPSAGNAFLFDGHNNEQAKAARKKGISKFVVILVVCMLIGGLVGVLSVFLTAPKTYRDKVFSCNGMSITLTEKFTEVEENMGCTAVYDSQKVAVFVIRDPFSLVEGLEDKTPEEYLDLFAEVNDFPPPTLKKVDGLTYFERDAVNPDTNDTLRFFNYVYKTNDSFWLIQFATRTANADAYAGKIQAWAKSVTFDK